MAFEQLVPPTPQSIADISIELFNPGVGSEAPAGARYSVQVKMSDGTIRVLTGDLVPHLTTAQINSLLAFTAAMRTKAVAEILG